MASEVNVSIIALIVALLALLITLGQLLQQIFSTADGYRRCQDSVIGPWSKKVRLKWRWSQFRFETMFTTPVFTLRPVNESERFNTDGCVFGKAITGSTDSRSQTMTPNLNSLDALARVDYVGWLVLLHDLHLKQVELLSADPPPYGAKRNGNHLSLIRPGMHPRRRNFVIDFKVQSWDFMPPEITRPLAMSTVGDMVVIAHRLNMSWSDLRPSDGIMRADGENCSISSTIVRGLGLVLQYSFNENLSVTKKEKRNGSKLLIPTAAADQFSCGIIPVNRTFNLFGTERIYEFPIYDGTDSMHLIAAMLEDLRVIPEAIDRLLATAEDPGTRNRRILRSWVSFPGFPDAIPLIAPFMPLPGSFIVKILEPLRRRFYHLMYQREFRLVLLQRLTLYLEGEKVLNGPLRSVLKNIEKLRSKYPQDFYHSVGFGFQDNVQGIREMDLVQDAQMIYDDTTRFFLSLEGEGKGSQFRYTDMVAAHLSMALFCFSDAVDAIKSGKGRTLHDRFRTFNQWGVNVDACSLEDFETVHLYVDRVLGSGENDRRSVNWVMKNIHGFTDREVVWEAWWTMMLRGLSWHLSTCILSSPTVPPVASHFYGSLMPVYIA